MLARLAVAVAWMLAVAASPTAAADSALYCDGALDGGLTGALTDTEHPGGAGDPPLPDGVSERRLNVDGVATRLLESGPRAADEAVVFVHGNPARRATSTCSWRAPGATRARSRSTFPASATPTTGRGRDYSTTGAARYIGRAIAKLDVRARPSVLHDLGGIWGLEWAVGCWVPCAA